MDLLHLSRLPIIVLLISLLPYAFANQQQTLTLHLPPNLPPLHPSTNALLIDTAFTRTALLTRANTFVFRNLTGSGTYLLDIGCRDWDFAPMVAHVREGAGIEVGRKGGGELKRMEGGGWEVRVVKPRQGWEDRGGCEFRSRGGSVETGTNELYSFAVGSTQESDDSDRGGGLWVRVRDALLVGQQYVCLFTPFCPPFLSSSRRVTPIIHLRFHSFTSPFFQCSPS